MPPTPKRSKRCPPLSDADVEEIFRKAERAEAVDNRRAERKEAAKNRRVDKWAVAVAAAASAAEPPTASSECPGDDGTAEPSKKQAE